MPASGPVLAALRVGPGPPGDPRPPAGPTRPGLPVAHCDSCRGNQEHWQWQAAAVTESASGWRRAVSIRRGQCHEQFQSQATPPGLVAVTRHLGPAGHGQPG